MITITKKQADKIFQKRNIKKKGKTFHKKKNNKKSLPRTCSCIKFTLFFMFENSMSLCHTDFSPPPFFFVRLLISFYFLYGGFHAGAVKFRWNTGCFPCFVFLKVQSMWCMRWDGKSLFSWSGAFMPSEGEFLSFIFLCVRVGNNLFFFVHSFR